jgi:hypothetical protein
MSRNCEHVAKDLDEAEKELEAAQEPGDDLLDKVEGLKIELGKAHDWEWIRDWEGDPSIPKGTNDLSHWECSRCGACGDSEYDVLPSRDSRDYY